MTHALRGLWETSATLHGSTEIVGYFNRVRENLSERCEVLLLVSRTLLCVLPHLHVLESKRTAIGSIALQKLLVVILFGWGA